VTVEAADHASTTKIYQVVAGQTLSREIRVQRRGAPVVIDAGAGGLVPFAGGGRVSIPPLAFDGVQPGEPVRVQVTYIDPASAAQMTTAPGDFSAVEANGSPSQLESDGMVEIVATDAANTRLELSPGQQVTVNFPDRDGAAATAWGLYTFNTTTGAWDAAGTAPVAPDGTQQASLTTVRRTANVDRPIVPSCIRVRVLTPASLPRPYEYVNATGISYNGFDDAWSDAQGYATFQVMSSSQVVIAAGPVTQTLITPPAGPGCPLVATLTF
jgi:hypothetical protein